MMVGRAVLTAHVRAILLHQPSLPSFGRPFHYCCQVRAVCKPLQSDKILLEGELELLMDKKRELRRDARLREGGGIRPGTQALVEQMTEIAGDPEEHRLSKAAKAADIENELAALKAKMDD